MYKTPELLGAPPPGSNTNLCPASVTNKVSKYAHLTVMYCPKPLSIRGLHPLDPTLILDLSVPQIRYQNVHLTVIKCLKP